VQTAGGVSLADGERSACPACRTSDAAAYRPRRTASPKASGPATAPRPTTTAPTSSPRGPGTPGCRWRMTVRCTTPGSTPWMRGTPRPTSWSSTTPRRRLPPRNDPWAGRAAVAGPACRRGATPQVRPCSTRPASWASARLAVRPTRPTGAASSRCARNELDLMRSAHQWTCTVVTCEGAPPRAVSFAVYPQKIASARVSR